jgi:hypothetical protein
MLHNKVSNNSYFYVVLLEFAAVGGRGTQAYIGY